MPSEAQGGRSPPPIFVAIDTADLATAAAWAGDVAPYVGGIKLGMEFVFAHGVVAARRLAGDLPLFLDLKLHDIPNTVAGGLRAVLRQARPRYITVHASGGAAMMRAAADAVASAGGQTRLLGVTMLTSLDDSDLTAVGQLPPAAEQVLRLARLSNASGGSGVVCSPTEVAMLRHEMGPDFDLVVPGIRPAGADVLDQKRVMSPQDALAAGATALVIGRPITGAADPAEAARAMAASLSGAA